MPAVWLGRALAVSILSVAAKLSALEPVNVFGAPVALDITNTSTLSYNADNRDTRPNQVATLANDDWGLFYNRLNVLANGGVWQAGLRLDNAWFFASPDPTQIALDLTAARPPTAGGAPAPVYFRQKVREAGVELSNRYINWMYPAKYYFTYNSPALELGLGDVYVAFGRGLVLSLRKLDELASDTTLRGARITARARSKLVSLRATAVAGSLNPLRIDPASGRYLGVDSSVTPGFVTLTEAGMPRAVATDFVPDTGDCKTFGTCSYAPDRIFGGQLELSHKSAKLAIQGSQLVRSTPLANDVVRSADRISTGSASFELADLAGHGGAYLEVALQDLHHPESSTPKLDVGQAVYLSLNVLAGPLSLLFEGKHYRRFFPLLANVSPLRAREFSMLAASAPPTTEALFIDTAFEAFNTCVSGGRLRGDLALSRIVSVYAWAGYYQTFAESLANESCEVSKATRNNVLDTAVGVELHSRDRRSKMDISFGSRVDDSDRALLTDHGPTHVFYREVYTRHQGTWFLGGPFALELQGWHRRRHQTLGGPGEPWSEGDELIGLDYAPRWSIAAGFSYDTNPAVPPTYFNGQLGYRISSDSSVSLFVGQRRGALRCVGGVCRVFPPFEGAALDLTLRF
ncbi:MAG TPA: DUF6029 family protein [Polyangiaceae bacterium]|nr:DUF6029 family protein [Polyangiaceae bacterium]